MFKQRPTGCGAHKPSWSGWRSGLAKSDTLWLLISGVPAQWQSLISGAKVVTLDKRGWSSLGSLLVTDWALEGSELCSR